MGPRVCDVPDFHGRDANAVERWKVATGQRPEHSGSDDAEDAICSGDRKVRGGEGRVVWAS